jgi:hypothetical protein
MSVAFVREEGAEAAHEVSLPPRAIFVHPNLVTQSGLRALEIRESAVPEEHTVDRPSFAAELPKNLGRFSKTHDEQIEVDGLLSTLDCLQHTHRVNGAAGGVEVESCAPTFQLPSTKRISFDGCTQVSKPSRFPKNLFLDAPAQPANVDRLYGPFAEWRQRVQAVNTGLLPAST